jgi:multidrug efflux pump subunit AcrA (membrane-fusion protein)
MHQQLQKLIQKAVANKTVALLSLFGLIATTALAITMSTSPKGPLAGIGADSSESTHAIEIATVGATSSTGLSGVERSWPGEILSLGNLEIQPEREGTIAEWRIHIGESVRAGQVLGTLSRPPATPELIGMLASEAEGLAKAQNTVVAERIFIDSRIKELEDQRKAVELSSSKTSALLDAASPQSTTVIVTKKKSVRAALESTFVVTYPLLSGSAAVPQSYQAITLMSSIGAQDSRLRDAFPSVVSAVITDLRDVEKVPENSGLAYFDYVLKLANASLPDGASFTANDLALLKSNITLGRKEFIESLDSLRTSELESVSSQKDYATDIKEIDAKIAELRKDLAIAEGDVLAKEAAYKTVNNAVSGGNAIVSPRNGVVSTILKKLGEFVAPGMPVAVVTSGGQDERIIRFSVPNNILKPTVGDTLVLVRPGFSSDQVHARLVGIGSALDDMGSYMADAVFVERNDWPIGASVRVLPGGDQGVITVGISSILWNEDGKPYVFGVTTAGRLYAKTLTLGRTLGAAVEVYAGLVNGDRYVVTPTDRMHEDALLSELVAEQEGSNPNEPMGSDMEGMDIHSHE